MAEQTFPAWFYGPKGEAQVFDKASDVPKGWKDYQFGSADPDEPVADEDDGNELHDVPDDPADGPTVAEPLQDWELDPEFTLSGTGGRPLHVPLDYEGEFAVTSSGPIPDPDLPPRQFSPFDHDKSGSVGGSPKGAESTASKGKRRRKRKA